MNYDQARIDDAVLALLAAFSFDNGRAWKGFEFEVMDRLFQQGLINDPKGRAKSVWLTEQGLARGRECAQRLFGAQASTGRQGTSDQPPIPSFRRRPASS